VDAKDKEELVRIKATLEKMYDNAVAQGKVAKDLLSKVNAFLKRKPTAPAPAPVPKPAPAPAPTPTAPAPVPKPAPAPAPTPTAPAPAPKPAVRSREQVTDILLEEFSKQTSFVPGGANGSATEEEIQDPSRAMQLWTTNLMELGAASMDETVLRSMLKNMIAKDVAQYKWNETYPPSATALKRTGITITGAADMPAK
jgi:outer membrane biosynthesis protein TonB